jgi:hypothetical protein
LRNLYDLPDENAAKILLTRLQSAGMGSPVPITRDTLETDESKGTLLSVGGPGRISVRPEDVVVTEMNGRMRRVLAAGVHKLLPFEQVKTVLDLRPQERDLRHISLLTKDGIDIYCHLGVTFALNRGGDVPTREKPYPYDEQAVRKAAYATTVFTDTPGEWSGIPLPIARGQLEDVMLEFDLDDLITPSNLGGDPHLTVRQMLESRLQSIVQNFGIEILGIRLGAFDISPEVTEQRIEFWRTKWDQARLREAAQGESIVVAEKEKARSAAQMEMVQAIVAGIEQVKREHGDHYSRSVLAMRLLELMQAVARRSSKMATSQPALPAIVTDSSGQVDPSIIDQARAEMLAEEQGR